MPPTASQWPELETALRALSAESGGGSLFIALLPPLVQVRNVQLPPVDAVDAIRLVSRSAGKYFVGAREPQVVGVHVHEGVKGAPTHAIAGATPSRVVQAIFDAAVNAGWKVARILPAHSTWISAADLVWAKSEALVNHGRIIVVDEGRTEILFKADGRPDSFRHLRGLDQDVEKLLELVSPGAPSGNGAPGARNGLYPVALIADDVTRKRLAPALRERGLQPLEPEGLWSKVLSSPALSAAHFAPLTDELELITDQARVNRDQSRGRLAAKLGVAAAILLVGGLAAQYAGLRRERNALQAQRDSIRVQVTEARDAAYKIGLLAAPISALDSMRSNGTRWSIVLSDLAVTLPNDSYITSLRGKGDSLSIDGLGKDAGSAVQYLRQNPSLLDVRQSGQIVSDFVDGQAIDRFALVAKIRRDRNGGDQQ